MPDQDYYLVPAATTPEALTYAGSFGPLPPVPVSRSNCFQEQTSAGAVFFIEPGEQQRVVEFTSCSPAQNSVQIYEVSSGKADRTVIAACTFVLCVKEVEVMTRCVAKACVLVAAPTTR